MGWFDFLKRKKKKDERENPPSAEPRASQVSTDDVELQENAPQPIGRMEGESADVEAGGNVQSDQQQVSEEQGEALRNEYENLIFLDAIYANQLLLAHEEKSSKKFLAKLEEYMENNEDIRQKWSDSGLDAVKSLNELFSNANNFATEKGMSRSPKRTMNYLTLGITGGVLGLVIVLSLIPSLAQVASYLMYVAICVVCLVPNVIKRYMSGKLSQFQEENLGEFNQENMGLLEEIHDMAQDILDNLKQGIEEAGLDISGFKFQLQNSDYKDIVVLNSVKQPGRVGFVYVVKFKGEGEEGGPDSDVDFDIEEHVVSAPSDVDDDIDDLADMDEDDMDPTENTPDDDNQD
ncbi:hypothetical protein GF325_18275 [Candidatus Bathyarchaeota archaeon]|nr:hypothetical protein [Candidatus Bathyarchaeota archaeon]